MRIRSLVAASLLALSTHAVAADDDYVWVEGEDTKTSNLVPHNWYSEAVNKPALSGGAWISQFTDKEDGVATYEVAVPKDGEWTLWARVNPVQAKVAYQVAGGEWKEADLSKATDQLNIANDAKPDLRFVAWVKFDKLTLKAGKTPIAFKFHSDNNHHGGLDCFLLTTKTFLPNGAKKPGPQKADTGFDASSYVWVEGEDATETNAKPHNWYSEAVKKDALSGGGWVSSFDGPAEVLSSYDVTVPKAGDFTVWMRINPIAAKVAYRINGGEWVELEIGKATDQINLASDSKPDLRFIAWVKGGTATLPAGKTKVEVKFHSEVNHHGALDCFVLAAKPFAPNGKTKPGARLGDAEPGWWAFEAGQDEFGADALLDLSALNEKRAGAKGRLAAKGDEITLGDGTPTRFWAVNIAAPDDEGEADYLAARLAKTGVNLARIHGGLFAREGNAPIHFDKAAIARLQRVVEANAKHGIYSYISTYFPLWMQLQAQDGIAGGAVGKNPFCLVMFEPKFQALYKSWLKDLFTTPGPNGKTLAQEPAVGFFETQNEDSFLFWTFGKDNLGEGPWKTLCGQFAQWAAKRYGSADKALAAWGQKEGGDDAGSLTLYGAWDMTGGGYAQAPAPKQKRVRDQIRFLAELQHDFYAGIRAYVKELGYPGLVTGSNWTTADNKQLGMIERWTYSGTDVIDRHGYFGGKHEGDGAGFSVRAGNTYEDKAAVLDPTDTQLGYMQLAGKPHIHTEIAWNKPNRFNADGDLLMASYGALQGIEAFFIFTVHSGNWINDGGAKWPIMIPSVAGQFPAAALQFRRGDITPAPVVLRQSITTDELFALKGSGIIEGQNVDFRMGEAPKAIDAGQSNAFDPLSYYAGRVERAIDDKDAKPVAQDLSKLIDRGAKVVTSATGQLRWDWGNGVVRVDSPRSQAVTGFLSKAGSVKLGDVTIAAKNEYGTVHVISLDGQPLASSKKILVQSFTEEKMNGFQAQGGKIIDVGHSPINVRDIDATVTFANAAGLTATVLDEQGYKRADLALTGGTLVLPKNALYVVVTRK